MFSSAILRMPHSGATSYFGRAGKDAVNFSLGEPKDEPPKAAVSAYIDALRGGANRYAPVQGTPELREAIAEKLRHTNDICASPDEILVTGGASEALAFSILSIADPGDEVIIAEPGYPVAASMVKFCGAKPVPLLLRTQDNFQPSLEALKNLVNQKTKMLIINTPHNPTGAVFDKSVLKAISEIFGGVIMVDEVYENFTYGAAHHSIASLAERPERIITVNSFSKTYSMCGYRVGYLHAEKDLVAQMLKLKLCVSTCTSNPSQRAAVAALNDLEFPNAIREKFRERRDMMVRGLKDAGFSFSEPTGAFYVFPDVSELGGGEKAFELFLKAGVLAMPGSVFHEECKNYIRFSFAAGVDHIAEGIERIRTVL